MQGESSNSILFSIIQKHEAVDRTTKQQTQRHMLNIVLTRRLAGFLGSVLFMQYCQLSCIDFQHTAEVKS